VELVEVGLIHPAAPAAGMDPGIPHDPGERLVPERGRIDRGSTDCGRV